MDCEKIGELIYQLRKEEKLTQKQLADKLNISDKTISKWERGLGCPDISLLNELSQILKVNIDRILQGELLLQNKQGGSMKRIKFYICKECGNIMTSLQDIDVSCCGRKLEALKVNESNQEHSYSIDEVDGQSFISFDHEMAKEHYLSFVVYIEYDRVTLIHLYPEQDPSFYLSKLKKGQLYVYCTKHGLIKL
ncbi:MAG: helix-turn-helix domain-containing protein [Coprobacillus sp.]